MGRVANKVVSVTPQIQDNSEDKRKDKRKTCPAGTWPAFGRMKHLENAVWHMATAVA
jgi:hypothetical protein